MTSKQKKIIKGSIINNRIVIWDIQDSSFLFEKKYYGKPIGIPKPKIGEIDVPLLLDLIEGFYLLEKSDISIYDSDKKLTKIQLQKKCDEEYDEFEKKYLVYKYFRDKKYIVTPGIKFGCDFAVYQKGPGIDHAPYLIRVYTNKSTLEATDIILAGRLATSVRKDFILAIPHGQKIDCISLKWWRP